MVYSIFVWSLINEYVYVMLCSLTKSDPHVLAVRCALISSLIFFTVSAMRSDVSFSTSATHN